MDAKIGTLARDEVSAESQWDLTGLYSSDADWNAELTALEGEIKIYASFAGTLGESALKLKACLEFDMNFSRQLEKLHTFAHLKNDEDKTNSLYQGNYEKVMMLVNEASKASSFMRSEIMSIPEDMMRRFLTKKELEFYWFHLEQIFQSFLQNYDRRVRQDAFHTYYKAYESHQYTYSTLLAGSIKKDLFYSRAKNFPSYRAKSLFSENIAMEVYDNLIESVHQNLDPLYKYFGLRKHLLKLEDLHIYDCSVPLVEGIKWHMSFEQAVKEIRTALNPLGEEYVEQVTRGLTVDRWTDRYENKGKRSGAYSSGCYDSNPFILMNYREDNINSVYTLAHEAGHSMHSLYSRKNQPYLYSDYTIFVAEVASTFNEALLTRHFLGQEIDPDMRIYLVCREIDNFRGTLYRQTMFAEFEHQVYKAAEGNDPLTLESFKKIYSSLLERYFGPEVVLDDCLPLECFRIPHFYFSFYVYKYATGISAAYALSDRVLSGGEAELNDYLGFLKSGGSKYPIDLLKSAGVDMLSPEPVLTALAKFSALVDELEHLTSNHLKN